MSGYPFEEYTRVAVLTALSNPAAPTVAEIVAGVDVTCDLTKDGLDLSRVTNAVSRARWRRVLLAEAPGKYAVNPVLKGRRYLQPDSEPLWDAITFRAAAFLVVRRGVPYETAWANGQVVEVLGFRWGMPSDAATASNARATFDVHLFVSSHYPAVVISGSGPAPGAPALLTEGGDYLLLESGDHLLLEP